MSVQSFAKRQLHKVNWIITNYRKITQNTPSPQGMSHFHGPITYNTDSITTSNNCDFIKEPRFSSAYAAAAATNPWPGFTLQWRVYNCCWFAKYVNHLEGDFVECGVNTGAYSRAIIDYIDFNSLDKTFYLLDTYEGLVESLVSEEEKKAGIDVYFGNYSNVYEQVKKTFAPFNVKVIKGMVPDTLPQCTAEKICYLSLDMNCVVPEIAAMNYFWDKLVRGAVVILDDYGFPMHVHQKQAFDTFAKEKNIEILTMPTGQGIFFKP
jgi:O-methyltransferase